MEFGEGENEGERNKIGNILPGASKRETEAEGEGEIRFELEGAEVVGESVDETNGPDGGDEVDVVVDAKKIEAREGVEEDER